jgi:hypothetical protein
MVDGDLEYLIHPLYHYSYSSISEYWHKAWKYTTLTAEMLESKDSHRREFLIINYMIGLPLKTFLSIWIRHKGFIDGWYGFLFAFFSSLHYPISYLKYIHVLAK